MPEKNSCVPKVMANEFNFGAFLLTWIWGLGNGTLNPIVIPVFQIVF